jgi:hypothetical protein
MRWLTMLGAAIVLVLVTLGGAGTIAGSESAGAPSGLTQQGRLLWNFEALLRDTFYTPVVSASTGPNEALNFSCAGWCGPNARYLHYRFTFSNARGSSLHISKRKYTGGTWGNYPRGILIRGHLIACNREETRFLISWVFRSMASFTLSCGGDPLGGRSPLRSGSWYGKVVSVNAARATLVFAPACMLTASQRWISVAKRESVRLNISRDAALDIYFRPDGDAARGHSQSVDLRGLADVAANGRLPSHPPGWFVTLRNGVAVSVAEDSGIRSTGRAARRTFACVWSRGTQSFVSDLAP